MSKKKRLLSKEKVAVDMYDVIGVAKEESLDQQIIKENYSISAFALDDFERLFGILKAMFPSSDASRRDYEILLPIKNNMPVIVRAVRSNTIFALAPRGPVGQEWHGMDEKTESWK